jgi:hypothetical protein
MVGRRVFLDGNCVESYPNERMKKSISRKLVIK